jgi:hypothetical protein
MCAKLNSSIVVHRLAGDLGLRSSEAPVQAVLGYCHRTVKQFLTDYPDCTTPATLLEFLANKLSTRICQIHSDSELLELRDEYTARGERAFATLVQELADDDTYGITLKLQRRSALWEPAYVSIIDCRGKKKQRSYHTKWHEVGHLLILTDQTRLAFRRTHDRTQPKSAEESLVDVIAGEFSFYPSMVEPHISGDISFDKIERVRVALCPEASTYSSILNLTKLWPTPCIWLEARLARKKSEEDNGQSAFAFRKTNPPVLRAVHVGANAAAKEFGITMIPNFRVPPQSVIHQVFANQLACRDATEDLSMWTSSDGARLARCPVRVQAKFIGDSVHALLSPLEITTADQ